MRRDAQKSCAGSPGSALLPDNYQSRCPSITASEISALGSSNTLGVLERSPGDRIPPQRLHRLNEGLPGTLSPPPSSAGGSRGSHRFARRRPLRPAPVAAAKTRRRHPSRPRASAPPGEPHWACSAPAGSGCCRWEAPHSRPPAAQPASLPGACGGSSPAVGAAGRGAWSGDGS